MIITRRKLFIALLLFTCIAVGMGFVFGRRIEQLRRFPPAYETEEASTGEVAPEIADIPIAEEKEPQDVGVGLAEKPSVDTEVRAKSLKKPVFQMELLLRSRSLKGLLWSRKSRCPSSMLTLKSLLLH